MDDLTTFLRAQLDSDTRRILDGWDSDGKARVATIWTGGEPGYTTVASDHGDGHWVADGREVDDARLVKILWDPKRELAEIDAKRRIIDAYMDAVHMHQAMSETDDDGKWDWLFKEESLEGVVKLLALPYADLESYREEWRP